MTAGMTREVARGERRSGKEANLSGDVCVWRDATHHYFSYFFCLWMNDTEQTNLDCSSEDWKRARCPRNC